MVVIVKMDGCMLPLNVLIETSAPWEATYAIYTPFVSII